MRVQESTGARNSSSSADPCLGADLSRSRWPRKPGFFILIVSLIGVVTTSATAQSSPPTPTSTSPTTASSSPSLPPEVTLASIVTRAPVHCTFIGANLVSQSMDTPTVVPAAEIVPKVMSMPSSALDVAAAQSPPSSCMAKLCAFLHQCKCPADRIEAMLRANCTEKLYKNCEIIQSAEGCGCPTARTAQWRTLYPDN